MANRTDDPVGVVVDALIGAAGGRTACGAAGTSRRGQNDHCGGNGCRQRRPTLHECMTCSISDTSRLENDACSAVPAPGSGLRIQRVTPRASIT